MGTGNSASNAAQQSNQEQQAQIQQSVAQINKAYSSPGRQSQYDQYGKDLLGYFTNQVNDQESTNARNLKFATARSGLSGGSAAVDSNTQLQKDYAKALLQASQQAQAGKANLQQADIQGKNQLISLAEQGDYTGAIPQQVAEAQRASLGAAQNAANPAALGQMFGNTAQIYQNEQVAAAQRKAQTTPIGSLYGGSSTGGGAFGR